jgi:tRNA 5-methylaminomethyl-2-thiouridine biosynthesis bifunctional protein
MKLRPRAPIVWTSEGVPYAEQFGDVYYSKHGGLAETQAVFLEPLGLPERWRGRRRFTLAELGFGAGLNALAAWDLWARTRDPGATLHFISIEGFPMDRADAARALTLFPELVGRAGRLLERWPCRASGIHRRWFPEDGFCLTLIHETAEDALKLIGGPVDGWLLDGFAPARNPAMWAAEVFAHIARASAPGARAATYSVAGAVRRGLAEAGFAVTRAPGFAHKRERLVAEFAGAPSETSPRELPETAVVIGGGIAGACTAAALLQRDVRVTIIDAAGLASGGSGNPIGVVSPRLDAGDDPAARFLRAAYLYAADFYRARTPASFDVCGLIRAEKDAQKAEKISADPPLPEAWLEIANPADAGLEAPAAYRLPQAGLLEPAKAITALTMGCRIVTGRHAARVGAGAGTWRVLDDDGAAIAEADIVVIAAGAGVIEFDGAQRLPVQGRRGALSIAPYTGPDLPAAAGGAYAFSRGGALYFGATFDPAPLDAPVLPLAPEDHARNKADLLALSPVRAATLPAIESWRGRASMRVTTPDHLPVAGALPDWSALAPILEQLAKGMLDRSAVTAPRQQSMFMLAGLGARGLTTAPLLGEFIAALAMGDPSPLPPEQVRALDPARFMLRAAQRRN